MHNINVQNKIKIIKFSYINFSIFLMNLNFFKYIYKICICICIFFFFFGAKNATEID